MRIQSFDAPPGSKNFGWLEIDSAGAVDPTRHGFRIEAGSPRLIRCTIDGAARLWARPDRYLQGIWVLRSAHEESPGVLPPWRFDEARAYGAGSRPDAELHAAWAKATAKALFEGPYPRLGPGTYRITRGRASTNASCWGGPRDGLLRGSPSDPSEAYAGSQPEWTAWEGGFGITHPLRARPREDDGRVHAWRKAAREGWLPPLVFLWVSGLNAYVLLDGHARQRAAELEGVEPEGLVVWRVVALTKADAAWRKEVVERYEYASRKYAVWQPETAAFMNGQLVNAFAPSELVARSSAVARADLRRVFVDEVRARLKQLDGADGHPMLPPLK